MKIILRFCFAFLLCAQIAFAQNNMASNTVMPFGTIDKADLELKYCSFEKDANAMILFKTTKLRVNSAGSYIAEVHNRIKIFNSNSLKEANISLPVFLGRDGENITELKAETFNLVNNKLVTTPISSDQIFNRKSDKNNKTTISFIMPQATVGSVIEYSYKFTTPWFQRVSTFAFQDVFPVRYALFDCILPKDLFLSLVSHPQLNFLTDTLTKEAPLKKDEQHWQRALANVPSFTIEPLMSSLADNLQRVEFVHLRHTQLKDFRTDTANTWATMAVNMQFARTFNQKINFKGEQDIIAKVNLIKDTTQKVAYLFNHLKTNFNVDDSDDWLSGVDLETAWAKKLATPSELNLILYYLLTKANINVNLLLVSTKANGTVDPNYPYLDQFNRIAVNFRDSKLNIYILEASQKDNVYNEVPQDLLNTYAVSIGMFKAYSGLIFIKNATPLSESVLITGTISPTAELKGIAHLSSNGYNKRLLEKAFAQLSPSKYKEAFSTSNDIKVDSLTLENNKVDSLPLVQNIAFRSELVSSDKYIFLNPCLFNAANPFLKQTRVTDIDFGFLTATNINCIYNVPAGYKITALPAGVTMSMPDQSISFKRLTLLNDGVITLRYVISLKQSLFSKDVYPSLYDFYKKMYNYINEQITFEKI